MDIYSNKILEDGMGKNLKKKLKAAEEAQEALKKQLEDAETKASEMQKTLEEKEAEFSAIVGKRGRMSIPLAIRTLAEIEEGDIVTLSVISVKAKKKKD